MGCCHIYCCTIHMDFNLSNINTLLTLIDGSYYVVCLRHSEYKASLILVMSHDT